MPGEEKTTDQNQGGGLTADQIAELEADIASATDEPKPAEGDPPGSSKKPDKPAEGTKPGEKKPDAPVPEPDPLSKMSTAELIKHTKGLQKAITEERGKRHKATDEGAEQARQLSDQLAYVQGQLDARNKTPDPKPTDPFEGLSDDDPLNVGQVKKLLAEQAKQQKENQQQQTQDVVTADTKRKNQVWHDSKKAAQGEYTEAKMGKGLDFDTVLARVIEMCKTNPGLAEVINASDNPGKTMYELGLSHPDSQKALEGKYQTKAAEIIVNKLNKTKPKTIHSGGSTKVTTGLRNADLEDLNADPSVTEADIMAELEKKEREG